MDEKEMLEVDIEKLTVIKRNLKQILDIASDIEDITDEKYGILSDIEDEVTDLIIDKEDYLSTMEDL